MGQRRRNSAGTEGGISREKALSGKRIYIVPNSGSLLDFEGGRNSHLEGRCNEARRREYFPDWPGLLNSSCCCLGVWQTAAKKGSLWPQREGGKA